MPEKKDYNIVSLVDVNQLLSFAKEEYKELDQQIKEEKRVEKELRQFIGQIQKHSKKSIHYIGHEKRYGKHLVRFLLKDGGYVEVMVEKPLAINGHFLSKKSAEKFADGLKKALHDLLPEDNALKKMILESIDVKKGNDEELVNFDTHWLMHRVAVKKTLVLSGVAIFLFLIFEIIKEMVALITEEFFPIPNIIGNIATVIAIALMFEPIKTRVEKAIEDMLSR